MLPKKLSIFLLIALSSLLLFLGSWGFTDSSEARYAEIGKEMFVNKDFVNPTLLGIKHFHKPPVTYYLTELGYYLFGTNEFGARFFMQVALIFQLLLIYKISILLYKNEKAAFASALIYFSFPIAIISVRSLTTDAFLTTFILASLYFWLLYHKKKKPYLLYLFYLFLGITFETKGPVGLVVPFTFIISYKIIFKEKIERNMHQFLGILLFLLVSAIWYLVAILNNEGLFDYFFTNQLIERVSQNKFKRGKPFWYYLLLLLVLGLPWIFYLIFKLKNAVNILKKSENKINTVLVITFGVMFVILSVSTSKLILYILPLYFIVALFTANYLSSVKSSLLLWFSKIYVILIATISIILIIISVINKPILLEFNIYYLLLLIFVFNLSSVIIYKKINHTDYLKPAYLGVLFIIFILMTSNLIFYKNEFKINSVKPIAKFIQSNSNQNSEVLVYNYLLPSLSFYLNQKIITINNGKYNTQREIQFEINQNYKENYYNYFLAEDRLRLYNFKSNKSVYLIKHKKEVLPDTLKTIVSKLKYRKEFQNFIVYY